MTSNGTESKRLSEVLTAEISATVQGGLKHVEPPAEKVVLPSSEDIAKERNEQAIKASIENFDSSALKSVETEEKVVLPSKEDIEAEKQAVQGGEQ